ncbi:putative xylulose kinase [Blattamonas nauphoetae]|uniref:Xylulose kinase n=1 Tax=Blattamonas nauphoetae TaxID=2049346 RepID=A0ABQ9YJN3_9EUKA|nr:putative xylulose kinase [Blattamonas nauphoetae]
MDETGEQLDDTQVSDQPLDETQATTGEEEPEYNEEDVNQQEEGDETLEDTAMGDDGDENEENDEHPPEEEGEEERLEDTQDPSQHDDPEDDFDEEKYEHLSERLSQAIEDTQRDYEGSEGEYDELEYSGDDYPNMAALADDEDNIQVLKDYIEKALVEHSELIADNFELQKQYAHYIQNNPMPEMHEEEKPEEELKAQFYDHLKQIEILREEAVNVNESANTVLEEVREKVVEKQNQLQDALDGFVAYKESIAGSSRNSSTGKPLTREELDSMMEQERLKDEEVHMQRLKNASLQAELAKYEEKTKKDDIQTQRHQIDFEQLKIENQTFNEKIEERTEELQKLRKKINVTVHVLSHFTEKLEFLIVQNCDLKEGLGELERETTSKRDLLANVKLERDRLKDENQRLRQENGLVGNEELLRDFKEKRKRQNDLRKKLLELQEQYQAITGEDVKKFSEKLVKASQQKTGLDELDEEEEMEMELASQQATDTHS